MKIGILVTARLGSKRLRKKHLLKVNDKPIISYLLKRILYEFRDEILTDRVLLIISTSDEPENKKFENLTENKIKVYYGSIVNIPLRHFQTAKSFSLDGIISIDGDDILCSVKGMRAVYYSLLQGAKYVKTSGLPFGMNSFGYSVEFLKNSIDTCNNKILETGWTRIFDNNCLEEIKFKPFKDNKKMRFTLDYKDDFEFFKILLEKIKDNLYSIGDEFIVKIARENRLFKINESIIKEYWNNFSKNLSTEGYINSKAKK